MTKADVTHGDKDNDAFPDGEDIGEHEDIGGWLSEGFNFEEDGDIEDGEKEHDGCVYDDRYLFS